MHRMHGQGVRNKEQNRSRQSEFNMIHELKHGGWAGNPTYSVVFSLPPWWSTDRRTQRKKSLSDDQQQELM
jgi:hypothetical protein